MLSQIPIQEYQLIGQFYQGWTTANPRKLFEEVIEKSRSYKSKALIALATLEVNLGNCQSGFKLYAEAVEQSSNPSAAIHAARNIAVVKGMNGSHDHALKDLEHIAPLVRHTSTIARYQYLNSLAVELGSVGRIEEAGNICRIVLASPYVFAYPEWRETGREIALRGYKSRSAVSLTSKKLENVLYLPERDPLTDTSTRSEPASVLDYLEWKKKMGKKRNGNDEDKKSSQGKTEKELFFELTEIISKRQFDSEQLCKLIDFADKISSKPESKSDED